MARPRYGVDAPPVLFGLAGAADRVSFDTADMTSLLSPDASFDLIVSSMAIHNIRPAAGRLSALDEALRVLRPGGRLVIADISATRSDAAHLTDATTRPLGWRMGGPWLPTTPVSAVKPWAV